MLLVFRFTLSSTVLLTYDLPATEKELDTRVLLTFYEIAVRVQATGLLVCGLLRFYPVLRFYSFDDTYRARRWTKGNARCQI